MTGHFETQVSEEDDEEDYLTWWFRQAGPDDELVLHTLDCDGTHEEADDCTCVPQTLRRGALA